MKDLSEPDWAEIEELLTTCMDLVDLVEGVGSVRWEHEGRRLKDTAAWAKFYVHVQKAGRPKEPPRLIRVKKRRVKKRRPEIIYNAGRNA